MDSVMAQYQKTVRPMFLQFIDPSSSMPTLLCLAAVKTASRLIF
jgi:uridine kinase